MTAVFFGRNSKSFHNINTQFGRKICRRGFQPKNGTKKAVLDSVFEHGSIHIPEVLEQAFGEHTELKNICKCFSEKSGLWQESCGSETTF